MIEYDSKEITTGYVAYLFTHLNVFFNKYVVLFSQRPNYDTWLNQIVASYQTLLDGKDRKLSRFLLDLPSVPLEVLGLLRDLCVDAGRYVIRIVLVTCGGFTMACDSPDRMQVGFSTLRGFVIQRPSLRTDSLNILLELTTHFGSFSR
jgi:symplekin